MDMTIFKIAIAAFLHDIGKFAERAELAGTPGFHADPMFLNDNAQYFQPEFNGKYSHKHAVYTAAFIDHIEKLLPKEFNKDEWGFGDSFMNLAARHHKPETPLQWVIAMADRVSSGFDRNNFEEYNKGIAVQDYKKTRLLTIFEGIAPDGNWKEDRLEAFKFRYPLKELSPLNIFPVDNSECRKPDSEQASREYAELFFNFIAALKDLNHKRNIPLWFEHFDSLFMIYASHIPAATVGTVVPDVSLYDHSKTTAALASAIYLYHIQNGILEIEKIRDYEDKKFLIVTGDFYGIQNFIFSEGGSTGKASAKLLRGRSFAVSLMSELAADMLCREIGLTPASIILNAAGKFTLIAPNTDEAMEKIKAVEKKVNDWLITWFYGETSIGISTVEAGLDDFTTERFEGLWERLARTSERKKHNKVNLDLYGGAVEGYLDEFNNDLDKQLCPFCGKRPSSLDVEGKMSGEEKSACKVCRDHIYLGTNLVKASRIAVATREADFYGDKLMEPIFGEYQVSLDVNGSLSRMAEQGALVKYWDIAGANAKGGIAKQITAKFINGYIPVYSEDDLTDENINRLTHGKKSDRLKNELFDSMEPGIPKTFHYLVKMALNKKEDKFRGIEALGVLKADVDNLGLAFSCGLRRKSISRLATMSRQLNYYFSVYLPHLLNTDERFRDIYTVFAGGDDLFLIGPWNRIVEFASFLNDSFKKYVCGNRHITISCGISVNKPGVPVQTIAEISEEALHKAKGNGRDSVTLFNEVVKWNEFEKLASHRQDIEKWMDEGTINNAMLFRLNSFSDMARQANELKGVIEMEDWECLKWRSKFKYNLVRNIGRHLKGEEKEKAIKEVEKAAEWLETFEGKLKIAVGQVIYNRR